MNHWQAFWAGVLRAAERMARDQNIGPRREWLEATQDCFERLQQLPIRDQRDFRQAAAIFGGIGVVLAMIQDALEGDPHEALKALEALHSHEAEPEVDDDDPAE